MLLAVIANRHDVLARYDRALKGERGTAGETAFSMRRELAALWGRSLSSRERLVRQLEDWCKRAESSSIRPLAEFSRRLRSYA